MAKNRTEIYERKKFIFEGLWTLNYWYKEATNSADVILRGKYICDVEIFKNFFLRYLLIIIKTLCICKLKHKCVNPLKTSRTNERFQGEFQVAPVGGQVVPQAPPVRRT